MSLDLSNLSKSIQSLSKSIQISKKDSYQNNSDLQETIQSGVIQNFEVAYEQCWKMLQRWLKTNHTSEFEKYSKTRRDLFRLGAKFDLITSPEDWFLFGEARNISSHTYNAEHALSVYEISEPFLKEATALLKNLTNSND